MGRRGGTQPSPISKVDVVEAAMRVVARSSLQELTVRSVAEECGVTAPAIHYHLRGGDDLADRVVEAVAAHIDVRMDPDASWIDQYLELVLAMDRAFLAYPGAGLHALTSTGPSAAATRLTDTALDILRRAGLTEDVAVQTFTATYLMFVGWLATRSRAERDSIHPALAAAGATSLGRDGGQPLEEAMRRILITAQGETT
ncbi:TetR/AcrR family transcriptional regulator [Mycolicibacterium alvei]|uniref:TetR/AcrR family transcriptional regulator n=2 Tax=Mycolicibacterium alvei TaxID=67081 RepID=UPI0013D181ED|nr:TetR family transcriptional regulator [Mycolicibacterium alvei]MCV7000779.1 TetR family transcriptional regulator [Mycolicibacterium alvei]